MTSFNHLPRWSVSGIDAPFVDGRSMVLHSDGQWGFCTAEVWDAFICAPERCAYSCFSL